MTKLQYSFVTSVKNVVGVLAEHASRFAGLSALVAIRNQIQQKLELIETTTEEQERSRTGITADKNQARDRLIDSLRIAGGHLRAWARQTQQPNIVERVPATPTEWKRVPQGKLAERASSILELAREHQDELRPYGLSHEVFRQFEERTAAYESLAIAPRSAATRRKTLTHTLAQELAELADLFDHVLDPLLVQFKDSDPKFYADYQNARIAVRPARTALEVIRERAATRTATAAARKEARSARIAAKAAAQDEAKAQKRSRLAAFSTTSSASGNGSSSSNGATVSQRTIATEPSAATLPN